MVQIVGYLYLHGVGNAFILLYSGENLGEVVGVLLLKQVSHHLEHALYALGKRLYLLLGFKH